MTIRPLSLLKILLITAPFEVLFIPGLPLQLSVSMTVALAGTFLLWQSPQPLRGVGIESRLLIFILFSIFTIMFSALTLPDSVFSVLPDSYGIRGSRYRGFYQLLFLLIAYLGAVIAVNACRDYRKLRSAIITLLRMAIAVNIFGFYELLAKHFNLPLIYASFTQFDYRSESGFAGIPRLYSVFEEPGTYGRFLAMMIIFSTIFILKKRSLPEIEKYPVLTVWVTSVVALLLTFSLSSILVLLLIFLFFIISNTTFRLNVRMIIIISIPFIIIIFGAIQLNIVAPIAGKLSYLEEFLNANIPVNSEIVRPYGMMMGARSFLERPLLGGGFGNELFFTYMPEVSELTFGSFNILLTLLVEVGLIGALIFLAIIWPVIRAKTMPLYGNQELDLIPTIMTALKYTLGTSLLHHVVYGAARLTVMDWTLIGLIMATASISKVNYMNATGNAG